jgi:hypothetical protein
MWQTDVHRCAALHSTGALLILAEFLGNGMSRLQEFVHISLLL